MNFDALAFTIRNNGGGPNDITAVAAVPEPETYAMLLVGLGLLGFVARKHKD